MPVWIHTHCPNCHMPYPRNAKECSACGRARDILLVPPPVVEAARPETYQKIVPPSVLRITPNDTVTIVIAILVALGITLVRIYFR